MDLGIRGKRALVTGGTHGIGREIALSLAREGCDVAVCSRNIFRVDDTVKEIRKIGVESLGIEFNALVESSTIRLYDTITEKWGGVDILVNNVGGGGRWGKTIFEETPDSVWKEVYDKNTTVARLLTMKFIPYMRDKKWGRVVSIASLLGKEGGGRPWFNMAKSSQISLMKTLAMTSYLSRDGITFNTIAPGRIFIKDTGWDGANEEVLDTHPMGRFGKPKEVAEIVVFVCSKNASWLTGACISADGGESSSF